MENGFEGTGAAYYRCVTCRGLVTETDIALGGCQKCGGRKLVPTNLTIWEKICELVKHPFTILGGIYGK